MLIQSLLKFWKQKTCTSLILKCITDLLKLALPRWIILKYAWQTVQLGKWKKQNTNKNLKVYSCVSPGSMIKI